jgi:aspartate racemase
MAECYLREVRLLQPEGPYFLAGFCMGGMVAFEMARRLQLEGQTIGLVALLESHGPGYFISPRHQIQFFYEERTLVQRIREYLRQLREATPEQRRILLWRKAAQIRNGALAPAIRLIAQILLWWGHSTLAALKRVHHANIEAQMRYMPQDPFTGRVDLFRAEKQPVGNYRYDPLYGWGACVKGSVEVHEFPGYHGTLFHEPNVSVLAEKLKARLQSTQASGHAPR